MAGQVAGSQQSRWSVVGRWLRDRVWATLDPPVENSRCNAGELRQEVKEDASDEVVREVYRQLTVELEAEGERRRAVEAKLLAVGAVAPVAVTIMVAAASFLSSGRLGDFVPLSVVVIVVMAFYVALQFLRATQTAIEGLKRRAYSVPRISEIVPNGGEGVSGYLRRACNDLTGRIEQHRETTNEKVSELAVAHQSMRNAVTALVVELVVLAGLVVWESLT